MPRDSLESLQGNAPPLLCAERLSFWLCGIVLRTADAHLRRTCLRERSTRARLDFVRDIVREALARLRGP